MANKGNNNTGYEPEKRGYQPRPTDQQVKPPRGGTGETVVQQDQGDNSSDSSSSTSNNGDC